MKLTHGVIYLLPDGQRAMCKVGKEHTFLMLQGKTGEYDTLAYMVAHNWLYQVVRVKRGGKFEWQVTQWQVADLAEVRLL